MVFSGTGERLIHDWRPTQAAGKDVGAFSDGIPRVVGKSAETTVAYLSWVSTVGSPGHFERTMQDSPHTPGPGGSTAAVRPQEGYRSPRSGAGTGIKYTPGNLASSPTTTRGEVVILPTMTPPTSLSPQCRMCDAPPTIDTRPTVTTCGHLFCYGYALRIVLPRP